MEWLIIGMVALVALLYFGPSWTGLALTVLVSAVGVAGMLYSIGRLMIHSVLQLFH